jgi:hypothetical protein
MSPDILEFYQRHKTEILKLVNEEHLQRPTHADMKYEFTTSAGNRYYTYTGKMGMPTVRVIKHGEFMDWFLNGLGPRDHKKIRDELFQCLAHIKAKTKEAHERTMQAGLLLNELELRALHASPVTGLINIAANQLIREDENPAIFSSKMHEIKCDELLGEVEAGNGAFFLLIPQLKDYLKSQNMSSSELMTYLQRLQTEEIKWNAMLSKVIGYMQEMKTD